MNGRRLLLAVLSVALVATVAFAAPIGLRLLANPAGMDAVEGVTSIDVVDTAFTPAAIAVPAGTEVTWRWADGSEHNVTFDGGGPSSPTQDSGTWSRSFEGAGSYVFSCTLHVGMRGRVDVLAG